MSKGGEQVDTGTFEKHTHECYLRYERKQTRKSTICVAPACIPVSIEAYCNCKWMIDVYSAHDGTAAIIHYASLHLNVHCRLTRRWQWTWELCRLVCAVSIVHSIQQQWKCFLFAGLFYYRLHTTHHQAESCTPKWHRNSKTMLVFHVPPSSLC